ncbi:MAG TPA: glycosyltransferase family 2 protein [Solirubrobacteraceae bacterium]|jgi:glycosyltransferase involved in cell wall biosynthesis|nr:glycosyltransferase family 2 protein [Solirubrobacteraceae bacterium]
MSVVSRLMFSRWFRSRYGAQPQQFPAKLTEPAKPGLSVVMATFNEADLVVDCIESVADLASEIVVVDGSSTDETIEVVHRYTDRVISTTNKLMLEKNKNLAIDAAEHEWVLVLDPDERVSSRLREEIAAVIANDSADFDAYWMPRRNYVFGSWLRTMGLYPAAQLRLVRRGRGRFGEDALHQPMQVDGRVGFFTGDLIHASRAEVAEQAHKRNLYSSHAAQRMHEQGLKFQWWRLLTEPPRDFTRQYFLMGGWLEGIAGLVYAALSGYGAFLRFAKLWELERRADRR